MRRKKVKKSTPSTNKGDKLEFLQDSGFKGKPIAMTGRRYGVAITWDPVDFAKPVDLDLQAIIIDKRGYIVDAVYYNNLIALNGAVSHSGDEVTGQASDFDEMVWAVFAKLPSQVKMMLFVVAACGDSALRDAANATVHVVQEFHGHTVLRFPCEKSRADVDVIVMMEKDNEGKWWLYQVDEPAEHGEHFLDILEPTVGDIIRRRIDNAPKHQRVTFQMKKGTAVDLPKNALKRLNFSVMATIKAKVRKEIDLDISALFTDKDGNALGACWHEELELFGFQHSGDRDADEDMNVDLLQVPSKVHSVYIVVDLVAPNYKEVSFRDITYASCMANDQNCKTLASFTLESGKDDCDGLPGLVLCRLVRNSSKRWELEAVGSFVPGPSWKEAVPTVQKLHYPKKANPQKAAALEAPEEPKHSKRKSRVEFRGGLPPAAHEGAVMAPIPDVAEGCEEGENQVMQTFSMNANDSDPSVMMSFSMEGGEECTRRAGRKAKKEANDPAKSQQQAAFSGEFDGIVELAPEAGEAEAEPSSWQDGPLCQFFCATQKTEPSA
mmetsp:Transcript_1161/g.2575  ORF Transcript_1161/g.2575 Transcript_1161/m.2575 type:complete len:551 (-) Transcript_1161:38-1690(-)